MKRKKIIAAFKTHFDYGYTNLAQEVLNDFCNEKLLQAIDICEKTKDNGNKRYVWTLPAFLLMKMYENCDQNIKGRLVALINNGQIVCHALPFTMHTELLDEKLLNNMFLWTDRYVKMFSKPFPIAAKMTDVPGHTSAIIQPLVSRGVKFLHLGKNQASLAPDVPLLFWWEDLQGNRILTMYNQDYGSSLLPPKNWKYPVWLALCQTYDNVGVQNEGYVEEISQKVANEYDFATGSLDAFAEELLRCDLSNLPVVRGELSNTWVHGNGTYPKAMGTFRRKKEEFYRLENLAIKKGVDIEREKNVFYENALIFCEHTFGINVLQYFGQHRSFDKVGFLIERKQRLEFPLAERSWGEQEERVNAIEKVVQDLKAKLEEGETKDKVISQPLNVKINGRWIEVVCDEKTYRLTYEYLLIGAKKMAGFQRRYLTRFFDWSISDFGRNYYPEIPSKKFQWKPYQVEKGNGKTRVYFENESESFLDYGNFAKGEVLLWCENNELKITLQCDYKEPNSLLEAGNFIIDTQTEGKTFKVEQGGIMVDVDKDIVSNSNQILWSVDKYAQIDDVVLKTIDAPLVSFGKNAIYEFNGGKPRKKDAKFVVNLFNNQWGTNFPQWIEGEFSFSFELNKVSK